MDGAGAHDGHRGRLRDRFAKAGPDALSDHELLELILFAALPRRDTKGIAKALVARFGSLDGVFGADIGDLTAVPGMGETAALHLKALQAAALRMGRDAVMNKPILSSWSAVLGYCRTAMAELPREQFRVLYLDKKNRLIGDEVISDGTVDQTPVFPREVVRLALARHASSMILVHNHPSGDPTPSRADIELTREIIAAAKALDISVHDHLIIARGATTSLRAQGLM
jgi:DNA repair protein RadC